MYVKNSKTSDDSDSVWVFGYGSLLWKPEFQYTSRETGFISGYKRRFWQGNCSHRGTKEKPGRVVTLVEDSQEVVWGVAFKVEGPVKNEALNSLRKREVILGGYDIFCTNFTARESSTERTVIVYVASRNNSYYLGDTDLETMSSEIVEAHGHAGSNVEYVVKLAEYCRNNIPEDNDPHLFGLERRIQELLKQRRNSTEIESDSDSNFDESETDEESTEVDFADSD